MCEDVKIAPIYLAYQQSVCIIYYPVINYTSIASVVAGEGNAILITNIVDGLSITVNQAIFTLCHNNNPREHTATIIATIVKCDVCTMAQRSITYLAYVIKIFVVTRRQNCVTPVAFVIGVTVLAGEKFFPAMIAYMIPACLGIFTNTERLFAYVTCVIFVFIGALCKQKITIIAFMVVVLVCAVHYGQSAIITNMIKISVITLAKFGAAHVASVVLFHVDKAL